MSELMDAGSSGVFNRTAAASERQCDRKVSSMQTGVMFVDLLNTSVLSCFVLVQASD